MPGGMQATTNQSGIVIDKRGISTNVALIVKQGDVGTRISFIVPDQPAGITDVKVVATLVGASAPKFVLSFPGGLTQYQLKATDTNTPGTYNCELHFYSGTLRATAPGDAPFLMVVLPILAEA